MTSKECLDLLMYNQKKVKNGFKFINLKTNEQATIEDCYEIIEKDLEVLEILKNKNVDVDVIKNIMKDDRRFECYPYDNLTQEEFNKIKEWLEK